MFPRAKIYRAPPGEARPPAAAMLWWSLRQAIGRPSIRNLILWLFAAFPVVGFRHHATIVPSATLVRGRSHGWPAAALWAAWQRTVSEVSVAVPAEADSWFCA